MTAPPTLPSEQRRTGTLRALALAVIMSGTLSALAMAAPPRATRAASNTAAKVAQSPAADDEQLPHPLEGFKRSQAKPQEVDEAQPLAVPAASPTGLQPERLFSPDGLGSTLQLMALMTVLSLVPSILIMTTCFVRFAIVLGLLRQALGTQQLPPNQVLMAVALFLTFMVMSPVWRQSYDEGIRPYTNPEPGETAPALSDAFQRTVAPIRQFMSAQIERSGNSETVWMLLDYQRRGGAAAETFRDPQDYDEVPLATLVSSFLLSEIKTAFVIGFQIYLPFLVIDFVVATVLAGMGMMMVPPALVSFPFKLLLFVLIDGWMLVVGRMLASVGPAG